MFEPPPGKFDFPATEKRILEFWDRGGIFERSIRLREGADRFVFYEGPPTANGMPHPGHCLTRVMKDIFPRYKTMCGYQVERKGGWDTHGLPVEREVEKELGLQGKGDIEKYGVEKFILKCINSVWRYTREWEDMTRRLAYWVDLPNAYATYHQSYVESVWWSLKELFERGLLYQAHKIVWWWPQGGTALSSGEVGEGYRTVDDPSVFVKFPLAPGQRILHQEQGDGQDARPSPTTERVGVADSAAQAPSEGGAGILPARGGVHSDLVVRRRRLPHWEAGGSTFFVTFRTSGATKLADGGVRSSELSEVERDITFDACLHFDGERFELHAAVVMPDHVHLLLTPLEKERACWWSLAELLHTIKSYSAQRIAAHRRAVNPTWAGAVWQEEYFDRIVRSDTDFEEKRAYIQRNPANRGLGDEYRWLWDEIAKDGNGGQDARPTLAGQGSLAQGELLDRTSLLVWTTTPWTLISNQFAAVHPEIDYALVHDAEMQESLIVAAELVERLSAKLKRELKVLGNFRGSRLLGQTYSPPFPEVYHARAAARLPVLPKRDGIYDNPGANLGQLKAYLDAGGADSIGWRVTAADFVTTESGTGLVHEAPAFGEVDYDLLQKERARFLDREAIPLLCAVNPDGTFNNDAPERYRGRLVFECDKEIIHELRHERKTPWGTPLLFHHEQVRHEYPFCPRAENDKLMQYARKSWFVRTSAFKDEFLKNSAAMNWLPEHIKEGRVGDFLRNNVDWALSRERYWGTPLPIWQCERCGTMEAVPSFEALKAKPGASEATDEHPEGFWAAKVAEHRAQGEELPEHLKVHKPYIDAWTYVCASCGSPARMRRVPEVIDCWWDAGSMPFAQWGYPHAEGSAAQLKARFPADFISEAIDQTRGWFYALLAINTLLFADGVREKEGNAKPRAGAAEVAGQYPLPFRTCIVLGHIAGEDGLKMSKRLRNYREPTYIFDTYGADAMRWYFLSAQAPWTSVRFQEAAIRDSQREFLVKLYNVLRLFTIYANIDGFDPRPPQSGLPVGWRPTAERGELDRWIVTELHRTVAEVRSAMDRFENYPAAQRLNDFVEALSNWYVRRSRERFWRPLRGADEPAGAAANQEKWDAYHTLYGCLLTVARLIAPFTPFFAEMMYQTLTGNAEMRSREEGPAPADPFAAATAMDLPISVHLADYPRPEEIRYSDPALLEEMDIVREIASLGRAARAAASVKEARKVRQPLSRVEVVLARPEHVKWLDSHKPLIAEELNVKQVEFIREADQYVTYKVVPNFPAIGKKYRALVPGIKVALSKLNDPAAAKKTLADTGKLPMRIDGQDIELSGEEVEIRLEAKPGWSAAQGRFGVVVLSTEVTPELRDEGLVRELIHHVQALRKELELPYEARVRLRIAAESELEAVLRRFEDEVKRECLAPQVEYEPSRVEDLREVKVESYSARLAIDRV